MVQYHVLLVLLSLRHVRVQKQKVMRSRRKNKINTKSNLPKVDLLGNGKPNAKGFVPLELADGSKVAFNTTTGEQSPIDTATSGNKTGITDKNFDTRGPLDKFEDFVADLQPQVPVDCSNSLFNKNHASPDDL